MFHKGYSNNYEFYSRLFEYFKLDSLISRSIYYILEVYTLYFTHPPFSSIWYSVIKLENNITKLTCKSIYLRDGGSGSGGERSSSFFDLLLSPDFTPSN